MIDQIPIFEKKNVIVTGGAGFIGSHLCERLLREAKVICIDDLSNSTVRNIQHLLQYPDFEFIKADVSKPIDLDAFEELDKFKVKYQGVQEVYHLACPTSPKNFEKHRLHSLWANSSSMINTLDLAVKYRATYLFASSSVVYGNAADHLDILMEDTQGITDQLAERACYNEGKRFAETCVETYRQVYGVDAKIARIFTTFGPRMRLRDGLLIPDFIVNALEGKDLVIYGDESQTLSLLYISDLVDGLIRLMHSGPKTTTLNIGSDHMIPTVDIARYIIQVTESSSKVVFESPLDGLHKKGKPDVRKAKEELSWMPLVRLEDGLQKTVDYTIANKEIIA